MHLGSAESDYEQVIQQNPGIKCLTFKAHVQYASQRSIGGFLAGNESSIKMILNIHTTEIGK